MVIRSGFDAAAVADAAHGLANGELVAFPTETVYGLGARADDDAAVARLFAAKGRPADHPLIVHVAGIEAAGRYASQWPALADRLARRFWPGPLTLIVPRRSGIAQAAAAGQATIGLRCPSHAVAQALLGECAALGVHGIAAPSANRFGHLSATTAAHVVAEFGDALQVLDGGACPLGIESAIVDCSRGDPVLLRPGGLSRAHLDAALAAPIRSRDAAAPRSSGDLPSHYAPAAKLRLLDAGALREVVREVVREAVREAVQSRTALPGVYMPGPVVAIYSRTVMPPAAGRDGATVWRTMPGDAEAAARELFATLREFDALGVSLILVERPPLEAAWEAVRDRLSRAAA